MKYNPFDIYTVEYEDWFKINEIVFKSELLALKQVIQIGKKGIEIGIGSGIFAEKLDIKFGIDPSGIMLDYARQRKLTIVKGVAENLPYPDNSFDFAAFITSICFVENAGKALREAYRIIKAEGNLIIAFIDRDSSVGQVLQNKKQGSRFYKNARFYSGTEMISLMELNDFEVTEIFQTVTSLNITNTETPMKGYGKGSFIVIKGKKK